MEETKDLVTTEKGEVGFIGPQDNSIFFNLEKFEFAKRVAGMLSASKMVPSHFQGQPGDCLIALNLSYRLGVDVFGLMQNSYTVHGRPGFEAKLLIALFNANTRIFFPPLRYEIEGKDFPHGDDSRCRCYAKDKETEKIEYGEWIDWKLVRAEGWDTKNGPDGTPKSNKWKTMPGQMFRYRAAAFFVRAYEPGLLLGIQTVDELEDSVIDLQPVPKKKIKVEGEQEDSSGDIYGSKEMNEKDSYRSEWINLKPPGFGPYIHKNFAKIEANGKKWPDLYAEQQEKWSKLYPYKPWPLIEQLPKNPQDEKTEGNAGESMGNEKTNDPGPSGESLEGTEYIHCPINQDVLTSVGGYCEKSCAHMHKCDSYQTWKYENQSL